MNLPRLSQSWPTAELTKTLMECHRLIEAADRASLKYGQDVEMGPARLILTDAADGSRYALGVSGGALTLTPL